MRHDIQPIHVKVSAEVYNSAVKELRDCKTHLNYTGGLQDTIDDLEAELKLFKQYYKESKEKLEILESIDFGYCNEMCDTGFASKIIEKFLNSDLIKQIENMESK